jgi:hypothetical protein
MQRVRIIAGVLLSLLAVAVPQSATAHEFVASKAGAVTGKQVNVQKFETNAGVFECKKASSEGSVTAGSQKTAIVKVQFSECAAFGFVVIASVAEFEFDAEGTATIKKLVTMEVPLGECELTLPVAGNSKLKTVTYKNLTGGKLEIKSALKSMTYGATGGLCGEPGTNGMYNGSSEVVLAGGTVEWK